ncbi:MAG TPA: cytochrome c, partial [Devosia sp.]|nr:cytochrome c [Devosia sp.]
GNNGSSGGGANALEVVVPELTALAEEGKVLFDANCAACHGSNAAGSDRAPPLVHDIYNPGHHPDEAFVRAALTGVRAHHWSFGNMPVITTVDQEDVLKITRYVRELQVANGIATQEHIM